jgi:hypothetical protein
LTGGAATQTSAGNYAVTANFTPTDNGQLQQPDRCRGRQLVINKATPTLSVNNSPVNYDLAQAKRRPSPVQRPAASPAF